MKLIIMPLIIFALALLNASTTLACSCSNPVPPREELKKRDVVFLGKVISRKKSSDGVEVVFKVERVWKGKITEEASIFTGYTADLYDYENMCAPILKLGESYLIYAYGNDKLETDVCTRTRLLIHAAEDLRGLGRGKKPKVSRQKGASQI